MSQVAWIGLSSLAFNRWIPREELVERGFEKLVNEYDGKLASEQKVRGGQEGGRGREGEGGRWEGGKSKWEGGKEMVKARPLGTPRV